MEQQQSVNGTGAATGAAKPRSYAGVYVLALLLSLALFGAGVYLAAKHREWAVLAAGGVSVIATLLAWPIAASAGRAASGGGRMDDLATLLNTVSEQQLLSDRAKSVAYRTKDREALRRAIREDLAKTDYEAALALCDEMADTFGYRAEADRFRDEVRAQRDADARRQINDAMGVVEQHIRAERWQAASSEADLLLRRFPDHEEVRQMPLMIEARRRKVANHLVEEFDRARSKNPDDAIDVLRRLDNYLTPEEAQSLQQSARNVFKEKLQQLKGEFAAAVHEGRITDAMNVGDEIVRDFPNTLMAREIKEKMPSLRARAGEQRAARV